MLVRVEVELDLFSGMPNPTWFLTHAEADSFMKTLAALPPTPAAELSGNLGYRGFIVRVTEGAEARLIHIQRGIVHMATGTTSIYAHDDDQELERWLLNTGKPHLKDEILHLVEGELQ
jgi:hypothetical protein